MKPTLFETLFLIVLTVIVLFELKWCFDLPVVISDPVTRDCLMVIGGGSCQDLPEKYIGGTEK